MKAYAQYTISALFDGEGALNLSIRSSGAATARNAAVDTLLTAEVRRGETLLDAAALGELGASVRWFRDGGALPVAEGAQLAVQTAGSTLCEARLERGGAAVTGQSVTFSDPLGGRTLRGLSLSPAEGLEAGAAVKLTRCGKNLLPLIRRSSVYNSSSYIRVDFDELGRYTLTHKDTTASGTYSVALNPLTNYTSSATEQLYLQPDLFVLRAGVRYTVKDCVLGGFTGGPDTRLSINGSTVYVSEHRVTSYTPETDVHVKQARIYYNPQAAYNGEFVYEPMVCEGTDSAWEPYAGQSFETVLPEGEGALSLPLAVSTLRGVNHVWTDAGSLRFVWETDALAWAQIALTAVYDGAAGEDGRTSYLHVKYSNDGLSFTADGGDSLGTWIGTLVDFSETASTVFSDYAWKRFSDDAELRREVVQYTESRLDSLQAVYLARSDFGSYSENVSAQIEQTARGVVESYGFTALIEALADRAGGTERYLTDMQGQIRRGLIEDPETHERHFGIAISESLSFTGQTQENGGLTYYELAPGQTLGLYTAEGWQFWINGVRRGWFSSEDSMLHVSHIVAEEGLRLGADWAVSVSGGFGLRYTGG